MLYFNLPRILKIRGITHPFSYFMSLGYSRGTASKMTQNRVQTFTIQKLEQYCIQFNCTPNDLFEFIPSTKNPVPPEHPLQALKREDNTNEINTLLHNLPIEKIRELAQLVIKENQPK
jgi:DNA-binding Xre family transcriptional regulator